MGQTAQASATVALSNGQSQNVTTGWRSDAVGVATVTDGGLVTGVANGQATISVTASGRQGQQMIRVLPDYHGEWEGTLRVTGCTQTGIFAEIRLCDDAPAVNSTEGFDLGLTQTGDSMNALLYLGGSGQTVPAPIAADGSTAFTGRTSFTEEGVTVTFDSSWQINSPRVGALTGTVTDVFRVNGFSGEGRLTYDVQSATRTATSVRSTGGRGRRGIALQGLGRRLRLSQ
jgi:hypothetical protein